MLRTSLIFQPGLWLLAIALLVITVVATPVAVATAPGERALLDEVARHAAELGVDVGFSAIHLESGRSIALNGDRPYPLASTYKIPMAAYALHLISEGALPPDQLIEVLPQDLVISSSITRLFPHPGIRLSIMNLLEAMLIQSDNTATDVVLRTIGGGEAVTRWLRTKGIGNLRVDRSTADLIGDYMRMSPPAGASFAGHYAESDFSSLGPEDWESLYRALQADPRDQGTPNAMARLLAGLWQDEFLDSPSGSELRAIMARCLTGTNRLSAGIPSQQLPLAHKTGTLGGTVNDVGVIELPDGAGTLVIVVFTSGRSSLEGAAGERAIAEIGRSVYDFFLFTAAAAK